MYVQLAWRNIWRNPRRTAIILTAIVIGIASMILLAALMRGMMDGMVINAINDLTGHVRIEHQNFRTDPSVENRIQQPHTVLSSINSLLPEGTRATMRLRVDAVINTARETAGITLVGIIHQDEIGRSFIGDAPLKGRFFSKADKNALVLGRALRDKLGTGVGKKLVVMSQDADGEIASKAFRVSGVFNASMEATEKAYVFVPLKALQKMLKIGSGVTEITFTLPGQQGLKKDLSPLTEAINQYLTGTDTVAMDWRTMLPAISAYLELFDVYMLIWYLVVFIAMGFGLVNTVLMAVYERMREFGLLKALGMRPIRIFRMVLREMLFLLGIGMATGNVLAFIGVYYLSKTGIDLSAFAQGTEMWGMSRMIWPLLKLGDIVSANVTVLVLGLVVGIYPALKAARFTPVDTMRQT